MMQRLPVTNNLLTTVDKTATRKMQTCIYVPTPQGQGENAMVPEVQLGQKHHFAPLLFCPAFK